MPDAKISALLTTAVLTSLLHTLIPDHWLPFVLAGRARGWTIGRTAALSGASALIHVVLSLSLGLLALVAGLASAELIGETLERATAWMLIAFGLVYAGWAWRKKGHFHPGGSWVHRATVGAGCDGSEGDADPGHLHYHADDALIRGPGRPGGWLLALIIGANPCVLVLPLMVATARAGAGGVVLVGLAYAAPTVALMVGLSIAGVAGARRVRLPGAARYMEAASGLLIAATGAVFLVLGH